MEGSIFTELSVIIVIGAAITLLMKLIRQPLVIGYILTGIIVGPVLHLIKSPETFGLFGQFGVALLLFIVGLDLSPKIFSRLGKTVVITTLIQVASVSAAGYLVSQLIGFGRMESLIIGLGLALSSTIIIVKLFSDKKETTRLYAQIAIGVLILQDLVATAAKIGMAVKHNGSTDALDITFLLARGVGLAIGLYLVSRFLLPRITRSLESSKELLLLFGLGWGLGLAALFERVGFSIEIGALLAGVSLASIRYSAEMSSRLKPLRDFFIVIFFIMLGQSMSPDRFDDVAIIALIFTAITMLVKPLSVLAALGVLGYTKRNSFKSAISMSQISEFSLVFMAAAVSIHMVSQRAVDAITLTALFTFAASTYLMKYDDEIYTLLERKLRFFERKVTNLEQPESLNHYSIVLFGYRKGGAEFIKTFRGMKKRFAVIDYDPDVIDILENQRVHYIYGDATDPELLEEVRLGSVKLVVSTMTDFKTNQFLAHWLNRNNPGSVFICSADSIEHAAELYGEGASYVIMPHFIGSEKIGAFIKKNGFNKTEFKLYREKHLGSLLSSYDDGKKLEFEV